MLSILPKSDSVFTQRTAMHGTLTLSIGIRAELSCRCPRESLCTLLGENGIISISILLIRVPVSRQLFLRRYYQDRRRLDWEQWYRRACIRRWTELHDDLVSMFECQKCQAVKCGRTKGCWRKSRNAQDTTMHWLILADNALPSRFDIILNTS